MIYTMGYSGRKLKDIEQFAERLDVVIFDIRYSPRSRNPEFSGKRLAEVLGERYRHIRDFGNRNYKGGPIELVDFDAGLHLIEQEQRAVILMCVCGDPAICHRTVIAARLRELGYEVEEVGELKPPEAQLPLF